jgi:hypothetical protein
LPCFLITVSINEIGGLMNEGGNVPVTVTVNLPKQAVEAVQRLAKKRHTTATEILRHAISLEKQLDDELDHGTRVLIEKDGDFRELEIRTSAESLPNDKE